MKSKLSLVFLTALLVFASLAMISAQQYSLSSTSLTLDKATNSTYFTITNLNTSSPITITLGSFGTINDSNNHVLTISTQPTNSAPIIIPANGTQRINVSYSTSASNMAYGNFASTQPLNITDTITSSTVSLSFNSGYCSYGQKNTGKLDLDVDYDVKKGFGEDEDWYPLDQIEVTVNVDNIGNEDLEDLVLSWCLYDVKEKKCVFEEEEDSFDLDEDDNTDITFTIDLDPDELTIKNEDYYLIVKVYGDSSDYKEKDLCVEDNADSVKIIMEKDFVALNNLEVSESIPCGEIADITGKAWNIGTKDQKDSYFLIYNKDLNILNQRVELGDIDSFESKSFTTQIKIPDNAVEKTYSLYLTVYDDDDDAYESEDKDSTNTLTLKVENCRKPTASISAELSEDTPRAIIGNQLAIIVTLKNTGTSAATYTLDVSGNTQWSTLAEIDPKTLTLNAGESKTAAIYLNINDNAEAGDKEFIIRAASGGAVSEQKISLTLEKGFSSAALIKHLQDNWLIYVIVLVNIVLIVAIILVVRSILKKSK